MMQIVAQIAIDASAMIRTARPENLSAFFL
jgi:hypothetical protein